MGNRRRLDENTSVVPAVVVDNGDGSYSLSLRTTVVGDFTLYAWAGDSSCEYNIVNGAVEIPIGPTGCIYSTVPSAVTSVPVTFAPTVAPTTLALGNTEDSDELLPLAAAGGSILGVLGIFAFILLGYRRKWQREKELIEEGNLYKLDAQTRFDPSNKLNQVGRELLGTSTAILGLTARRNMASPEQAELVDLMNEQEELQRQIADLKRKVQAREAQGGVRGRPPPKTVKEERPKKIEF